MLIVTAISMFLMTKVEINTDLTKYLPDKSEMKQGIDFMSEEFPETQSTQTIRVMFDDLKPEDAENIRTKLCSIPFVETVEYQADSQEYNLDNHTLFVIRTYAEYKSPEIKTLEETLEQDFSDYKFTWNDDDISNPDIPLWIVASAVGVILIILLVMCGSWIEPLLILIGIGFAVFINMGTNIFQGSISNITYSMASILQLILSMDYSIILLNRYKQEKTVNGNITEAMKTAVTNAFPSIASSGLTTVAGLLMLVFMSFKIGLDFGVVMAKGVFLSMFCVLLIMPGIFILFDGLIQKTAKKSPHIKMKALAVFSKKAHGVILAVFILLMVGAFILQQQTTIVYTLQKDDKVAEVFPPDNTLVLLYDNQDEAFVPVLSEMLEQDSKVKSVTSYYSALGKPYTAKEMAQNISEMEGGMMLDESVISMIYYARYGGDEPLTMTVGDFLSFLSDHVIDNETFSEYISEDMRGMIGMIQNYAAVINMMAGETELTPQQMADLFSGMGAVLDEPSLELMFLYKAGLEDGDSEWTMTIDELFDYLYNTLQYDQRFAFLIGDDEKAALAEAQAALNEGKSQLRGKEHSRMIITTSYPDESQETYQFIEELSSACDENFSGEYYLIGNSAMNLEMTHTFGGELLFITILTAVVIYLIVALTTRSFIIPLILVLIVQTGVYITVSTIGLRGNSIYYLALLIVQCILMGATIDYGILFTNYYTEYRKTYEIADAVAKAYEGVFHTIATSGLILILVTSVVGRFFQDPTITAIVDTLSLGSFIAIMLIIICLPGILITLDKLVVRKKQ